MLNVGLQRIAVRSIQAKIESSKLWCVTIPVNAKEHDDEKPSCLARNCTASPFNDAAP